MYRAGTGGTRRGWTALKREAGLLVCEPGPEEDHFSRRAADLLHIDDPARLTLLGRLPALHATRHALDASDRALLQMLAYEIDGRHEQKDKGDAAAFLARLAAHAPVIEELAELGGWLEASTSVPAEPLPGLADTPLMLHAGYGTSAGPDTPAGRRYLESAHNGWRFQLFVRARKGEPYRACGPVTLDGAEGSRPMSITWRLQRPLPARLFREFSVLRGV